jgi:hypothetical protein
MWISLLLNANKYSICPYSANDMLMTRSIVTIPAFAQVTIMLQSRALHGPKLTGPARSGQLIYLYFQTRPYNCRPGPYSLNNHDSGFYLLKSNCLIANILIAEIHSEMHCCVRSVFPLCYRHVVQMPEMKFSQTQ